MIEIFLQQKATFLQVKLAFSKSLPTAGFRVQGFEFTVQGYGPWVQGLGFRVQKKFAGGLEKSWGGGWRKVVKCWRKNSMVQNSQQQTDPSKFDPVHCFQIVAENFKQHAAMRLYALHFPSLATTAVPERFYLGQINCFWPLLYYIFNVFIAI